MLSQYNPVNVILSSGKTASSVSRSLHKRAKPWFEPRSDGINIYNHVVQVGDPVLRNRALEVMPVLFDKYHLPE
jgi:hypothetical protein